MQVPYELKPSSIAGVGVFATAPIARGTLLWKYGPDSVIEHDEASLRARLATLSKEEQVALCEHVYTWEGKVVEIIDDAKYWNHATTKSGQNTGNHPDAENGEGDCLSSYALRDIVEGEELTDDYSKYDEVAWYEGICKEIGARSCMSIGLEFQ
ncbi:hypothetical protein AB1Y20_000457 [Prymnesium parvum]|uniref:SET domain-containing protein n=1 Tax=Prymnesium parvum TaxID=97485 RepID=A0AB34K934_PRYPA